MDMMAAADYRLRLAEGYLGEARQDLSLSRWRSCVDNSQLATENAGKAALALLGPLGRTHNPAPFLRQAVSDGRFPSASDARVLRLAEIAELLGPAVHISTDYGDEDGHRTPWELFAEADAEGAIALAEEAAGIARELVQSQAP